MNKKPLNYFDYFIPFIFIGIAIALFLGVLFLFFYLVVWGVVIGTVLWLVVSIKNYFFPKKPKIKEKGRIIEHDNKKY